MTTWDKSQCDEVQGSDWEGDHGEPGEPGEPGGGGVGTPWEPPPEQICAEVLLLTTTPYAINFEESMAVGTPRPPALYVVQEVVRVTKEDGPIFGASAEALEWSGNNGYASDHFQAETVITQGALFGLIHRHSERFATDAAIPSGSLYGLLYDKAFDRVATDTAITGGALTAG